MININTLLSQINDRVNDSNVDPAERARLVNLLYRTYIPGVPELSTRGELPSFDSTQYGKVYYVKDTGFDNYGSFYFGASDSDGWTRLTTSADLAEDSDYSNPAPMVVREPPVPPVSPINALIIAPETNQTAYQNLFVSRLNATHAAGVAAGDYSSESTFTVQISTDNITSAAGYTVVAAWRNASFTSNMTTAWNGARSDANTGLVKCQFYSAGQAVENPMLNTSESPLSSAGATTSGTTLDTTTTFTDTIFGRNVSSVVQYYKDPNFSTYSLNTGAIRDGNLTARIVRGTDKRIALFNLFPTEAGNSWNATNHAAWGTTDQNMRYFLNVLYWAGKGWPVTGL